MWWQNSISKIPQRLWFIITICLGSDKCHRPRWPNNMRFIYNLQWSTIVLLFPSSNHHYWQDCCFPEFKESFDAATALRSTVKAVSPDWTIWDFPDLLYVTSCYIQRCPTYLFQLGFQLTTFFLLLFDGHFKRFQLGVSLHSRWSQGGCMFLQIN